MVIWSCNVYKKKFCDAGVDQEKWNRAKKPKPEAVTALNTANSLNDFAQREAIYDAHRDELTAEFK